MDKIIEFTQPNIGMDVEFFFKGVGGKVIGSEKVIDIDTGKNVGDYDNYGKIICDGVQGEINPNPSYCRALLGGHIQRCMSTLRKTIEEKKVSISFDGMVEVDKNEFDSLSDRSKEFGCSPDFDVHNSCQKNNITVNPTVDRNRSCGGHIHIGYNPESHIEVYGEMKDDCKNCPLPFRDLCDSKKYENIKINLGDIISKELMVKDIKRIDDMTELEAEKFIALISKVVGFSITDKNQIKVEMSVEETVLARPDLLIPMMDILVGIPSVLLDRDINASKRRKVYGKAGCFRYQPHGIEYRTLSNFWLKSYPLMGLIIGQARLAFLCVRQDIICGDTYFQDMFKSKVDMSEVVNAINNNDFKLAKKIFLSIEKEILSISYNHDNYPLHSRGMKMFKQMVIDTYSTYTNRNIFYEWDFNSKEKIGWESLSENKVHNERDIDKEFINYEG